MRDAILEAITSVVGWAMVILGAMLAGFCCGYWIGHGEVTGAAVTLEAMAWIPVVWLGQPLIFVPYVVTILAFFLPPRFETRWLHLTAVLATFLSWLVIVAVIVVETSHGKFWQW